MISSKFDLLLYTHWHHRWNKLIKFYFVAHENSSKNFEFIFHSHLFSANSWFQFTFYHLFNFNLSDKKQFSSVKKLQRKRRKKGTSFKLKSKTILAIFLPILSMYVWQQVVAVLLSTLTHVCLITRSCQMCVTLRLVCSHSMKYEIIKKTSVLFSKKYHREITSFYMLSIWIIFIEQSFIFYT